MEPTERILEEMQDIIYGLKSDNILIQTEALINCTGLESKIFDPQILAAYKEINLLLKQIKKEWNK